ncbi:hypothetical protein [Parageobacillus sp. G301]|uniref:hypothetical protein n=1 Tax=Parageobacillus sp. G301 TaxID=2998290 RepID=UPI0025552698|nr:hypothetical protein [Parageobacillus sp. G301]
MSTEEGYFPQGAASRSWTKRKAEVPRLALEAKCSSPVEVLAPQGRRLFGARELDTGARQRKSGSRLRKTAFFQTDGYLVLRE